MDGMDTVGDMAARIAEMGQPAWALTDHGLMGGVVQGYKTSKKHDLAFYPGSEFYVVRDVTDPDTREERFHLGMVALDYKGYKALTKLSTLSWQEHRFYRKPLIDLSDLAYLHDEGFSDHIAVTTGCYFGLVIDRWKDSDPEIMASAKIKMLASWFPNTLYVEMQNHGITQDGGVTDLDISTALYDIAQKIGLPVVIGGDSHYIHAKEQPIHDLMKDICYHGNDEDTHFPGGPFHLLSADEALGAFPAHMHDAIEAGHGDLLDKHRLSLPALDTYKFHVPGVYKDPEEALWDRLADCMATKSLNGAAELTQVGLEMHVICSMGMSDYFLLVSDLTNWCREEGIIINTRGSANGSLVAFILGITNVNPLVWGTSFDRFLSLDRKKPPDIDIDVDFRARGKLIDHMRAKFPSMIQVGTYAKIGITSSEEDGNEDKGSVFVQYMGAMRRKIKDWDGKVLKEHRAALNGLSDTPVNKSMGTNAAGFILPGDTLAIDDYLPLARIISSNTTVTQFNKDDVEALGYMKLDFLGLRALQTLNGCLTRIGRQPNEWDWIPYDDKDACALLRSGNCVGLFQYEGFSSQRGGKEMKIKSTLDTILGLALYRPALMNGGQKDLFLANRGKPRTKQTRLPALFDSIVADTAGVPLFQEQIMEILRAIGMEFHDYNDLMTAIKASNGFIQGAADTFARIQPIFYDLCEDAGLSDTESDDAWNSVIGFTEYGFNRAHATSYGLMSYYSAYLKSHFPLEYMASLLDVWAGNKEKEPLYTAEARRLGFSIVRADVNLSSASWDIDTTRQKALRKGLVCLKGIGENVAQTIVDCRPPGGWKTIQEFIDATPRRPVTGGVEYKRDGTLKGVCQTLLDTGAFRSLQP